MPSFNAVWRVVRAALERFGEFMSTMIFMVLYYTIFACFAIPYRLFKRRSAQGSTAYQQPAAPFARVQFSEEG